MRALLEHVLLRGERVALVPQRAAFAERAFELLSGEEEILRWFVWPGPADLGELRSLYEHWVLPSEEGDDYRLAVLDARTEELVGALSLRYSGHPSTADLGYWIGRPFQGRGYMTEALALAASLAFGHLDTQVLCAWVFTGNEPSRRVLEKNGFRLLRTAPARRYGERVVDEWSFTLTRAAWARAPRSAPLVEEVRFATSAGL